MRVIFKIKEKYFFLRDKSQKFDVKIELDQRLRGVTESKAIWDQHEKNCPSIELWKRFNID